MNYLFFSLLILSTCLLAQEGVTLNLITPKNIGLHQYASQESNEDCYSLEHILPENFHEYFTDLDQITTSINPGFKPFYALRFTQISENEIEVHEGFFQYEITEMGLEFKPAVLKLIQKPKSEEVPKPYAYDPNELSRLTEVTELDFLEKNRMLIKTMFLNSDIPEKHQIDLENLSPEQNQSRSAELPDLDIAWNLRGKRRIEFDGGIINLSKTSFIEREINRKIFEMQLASLDDDMNSPLITQQITLLQNSKRYLMDSRLIDNHVGANALSNQTGYISVTITFP